MSVQISHLPKFEAPKSFKTLYSVFMFLGLMGFVFTLISDPQRAWSAYLVSFFYFVSLALGGAFFTSIQHLTKAGWSVGIRRIPEAFMVFLKPGFGLALIFLGLGSLHLYEWMNAELVGSDYLLQKKQGYLNLPFFTVRVLGSFIVWILLASKILLNSTKQDQTGDVELTKKNVKLSVIFILFFALSFTFFTVDLLMSLEPHWFSTMIGVYAFAGLFQSSLAAFILVLFYLMKQGHLKDIVSSHHIHDLGKFLFGFTVFWAYIAYSQFMLIWYANLPEESFYYLTRTTGPWIGVSLFLIIFKFIVPFFALLNRWSKRDPRHLSAVCILILFTQYVDIYWLVYPSFYKTEIVFGLSEIVIFLGFLGVFLWSVSSFLTKNNIIPIRDPRLEESLKHEVTY